MPYTQETKGIVVTVQPRYLEDQSDPSLGKHMWAYTVRIENHGNDTVQLVNRYWRITNAQGQSEETRGVGVVGEQPILDPGDTFEYTSGAPLNTDSGFMNGLYEMRRTQNGDVFDVRIPAFSLDTPKSRSVLH